MFYSTSRVCRSVHIICLIHSLLTLASGDCDDPSQNDQTCKRHLDATTLLQTKVHTRKIESYDNFAEDDRIDSEADVLNDYSAGVAFEGSDTHGHEEGSIELGSDRDIIDKGAIGYHDYYRFGFKLLKYKTATRRRGTGYYGINAAHGGNPVASIGKKTLKGCIGYCDMKSSCNSVVYAHGDYPSGKGGGACYLKTACFEGTESFGSHDLKTLTSGPKWRFKNFTTYFKKCKGGKRPWLKGEMKGVYYSNRTGRKMGTSCHHPRAKNKWTSTYENCDGSLGSSRSQSYKAKTCACKGEEDHKLGPLAVKRVCLPSRVRGSIGPRLLWPFRGENVEIGEPMDIQQAAHPTDASKFYVSWQADDGGSRNGKIYVSLVSLGGGIEKSLIIEKCKINGGVVVDKRNNVAVGCASDVGWVGSKVLQPQLVIMSADLDKILSRFSVVKPGCEEAKCFGWMPRAPAWFKTVYSPQLDVYALSYQACAGTPGKEHHADRLVIVNAEGEIVKGGWDWACMNGHTAMMQLAINPNIAGDRSIGTLCASDTGNIKSSGQIDNGVKFYNVMTGGGFNVGPLTQMNKLGAKVGNLGSLQPCGEGWVAAYHGLHTIVDEMPPYAIRSGTTGAALFEEMSNDVFLVRFNKHGQIVTFKSILVTPCTREKAVKLTPIGKVGQCSRFLLGWGDMVHSGKSHAKAPYYPDRYWLAEIDGRGSFLTPKMDVTGITQWGENSQWTTLANGDVAWAYTWRRDVKSGSPRTITSDIATYRWNIQGYGFYAQKEGKNAGFSSNELFISVYSATTLTSRPEEDLNVQACTNTISLTWPFWTPGLPGGFQVPPNFSPESIDTKSLESADALPTQLATPPQSEGEGPRKSARKSPCSPTPSGPATPTSPPAPTPPSTPAPSPAPSSKCNIGEQVDVTLGKNEAGNSKCVDTHQNLKCDSDSGNKGKRLALLKFVERSALRRFGESASRRRRKSSRRRRASRRRRKSSQRRRRASSGEATFSIAVKDTIVCATREDQKGGRWSVSLKIRCLCVAA